MAETTGIEWCDHTFNPWRGCTKVSEGCRHCYAETLSGRNPKVLGEWGPKGARVVASDAYWRQPLKWDKAAKADGMRRRVFCASLADVFEDRPELVEPRCRLLSTIYETPNLDWLLLTKRPELFQKVMREAIDSRKLRVSETKRGLKQWFAIDWLHDKPPTNVWLGVSVENQATADERIPLLLQTPAAVRFVSYEPALEEVRFARVNGWKDAAYWWGKDVLGPGGISWLIVGGESGPRARPCRVEWVRSAVRQCKAAGVACFVKQLGTAAIHLRDHKGGDPSEWPEDLRVREFPKGVKP